MTTNKYKLYIDSDNEYWCIHPNGNSCIFSQLKYVLFNLQAHSDACFVVNTSLDMDDYSPMLLHESATLDELIKYVELLLLLE